MTLHVLATKFVKRNNGNIPPIQDQDFFEGLDSLGVRRGQVREKVHGYREPAFTYVDVPPGKQDEFERLLERSGYTEWLYEENGHK